MIKSLPIVVRELQVASRRPSTHGWRMLCSLAGSTLVMVALMSVSLASLRGPTQSGQGQGIFHSLSMAAFVFCALAGVFACSDALSRERREGTLRLLFLTDLHPLDVILGKWTGHGINLFFGLLGMIPFFALTFQLGGVTFGLFLKTILFLFNTLFLSMAATLLVSSFSQDERRSLMASLAVVGTLILGPVVFVEFLVGRGGSPSWFLFTVSIFSPMHHFPFLMGSSSWVSFRTPETWASFAVQWGGMHLAAWSLLWLASRGIMEDASSGKPAQWWARLRLGWHYFLYGSGPSRRRRRQRLLDHHPMVWMVMREKLKEQYAWVLVISVAIIWSTGYLTHGEVMGEPPVLLVLGWFVHLFLKIWVAAEAATLIAEDRRSGSMELLVTTPMGARGLVQGIFKATLLQFTKPMILLLGLETWLIMTLAQGTRVMLLNEAIWLYAAGMFMLLVNMASIGWVAIWYAILTGSAHKGISRSVLTTLGVPWVLFLLLDGVMRYLATVHGVVWMDHHAAHVLLWILVGLGWNAVFAWGIIRRRVLSRFERTVAEGAMGASKASNAH